MIFRRLPAIAALAGLALLAACSTPATRVVLLPQADGSASSVVVRANNDAEQTLSQPFQRATTRARGAPSVDQVDPGRVQSDNRLLFELAPPPTQRFVVYFDLGSVQPTAVSMATLAEAASRVRAGGEIVITGHTDTVGNASRNDELSTRRAAQVRDLLVARGFPADRIRILGRGKRELAVPTADFVEEARNRRVTIEVR